MYCPYCGSEIPDHLTVCNVCGNKLDPNTVKGKSEKTSDKPSKDRSPQKHETCLRSVILAAGIAIGLIAGIGISLLRNTKPDPPPDVPPEIPVQSNTSEQASAADSGSEQVTAQNTEHGSAQNTASGTTARVPVRVPKKRLQILHLPEFKPERTLLRAVLQIRRHRSPRLRTPLPVKSFSGNSWSKPSAATAILRTSVYPTMTATGRSKLSLSSGNRMNTTSSSAVCILLLKIP